MKHEELKEAIKALQKHIESSEYRGFDPYDGLESPIFQWPIFRSWKSFRFYAQQLVKRSSINLRPLLGIKPGLNPVTLGLCLQSYSYLALADPSEKETYLQHAEAMIDQLSKLRSEGYNGLCWGYNFDWEARYASIPAFAPTIVATGIITNALYENWSLHGNERSKEMLLQSRAFVLEDLNRSQSPNGICFSYSPLDQQLVLNASMKAARLLAQCYSIAPDREDRKVALDTVNYVLSQQAEDGSFPYSDKRSKIDHYHTAYVIDCLHSCQTLLQEASIFPSLEKAYAFYKNDLITDQGHPKFYSDAEFPLDCTAAGQGILSLCRFQDLEIASEMASYTIQEMQSPKGSFYFRKYPPKTNKSSFMRWSDAWMFAGLSSLLFHQQNRKA
ncbi:MAG: hypothetical protein EP338_02295 [Bacteroidetes bacterium]|nr:MAG: hypothetical protein EP338_02295 [Bacteroidota bacterium]